VVGAVAVVGGLLLQDYVSAIIALLPRGLSFRDQIWSQMLTQMSAAQWVWGHGLGHPLSITLPSGVEHVHPHSIYFTMLFSSGLIGLLMLLAVLGNALLSAFRRPELRLAGVLLAYSMGPLALDGDQLVSKLDVHWLLIWLPLGLIAAGQVRADTAAAGS
jgi:O-antigen ligase